MAHLGPRNNFRLIYCGKYLTGSSQSGPKKPQSQHDAQRDINGRGLKLPPGPTTSTAFSLIVA